METKDQKFMKICLDLAKAAKENGHTPVGSLIVRNGEVLAKGMEGESLLPKIMSHAENVATLKAIEKLGTKDLSDCELYTTVEPCFMCTYLIRQTKISRVVYATTTPAGGDSSPYPILKVQDIPSWKEVPEVVSGVLKTESEALF